MAKAAALVVIMLVAATYSLGWHLGKHLAESHKVVFMILGLLDSILNRWRHCEASWGLIVRNLPFIGVNRHSE